MGRPTKLTRETANFIVNMIEAGVPRDNAARAAGIHPSTLFDWLRKGDAENAASDVNPDRHTKAELQAIANDLDLDYTKADTKAELAAKINDHASPYAEFSDRIRAADSRFMAHAVGQMREKGGDDWRMWANLLAVRFPEQFALRNRADATSDAFAGTEDDAQRQLDRAREIVIKQRQLASGE